jgi:hypothetical protein
VECDDTWAKAVERAVPSTSNRAEYEHSQKLEYCKILRFGFWHAISSVHAAEMEELELTEVDCQIVITNITDIHTKTQACTKCYISFCVVSLIRPGIEAPMMR